MTGLQHYQRYQWWYGCAILCTFMTINAFTLATSVIMEASRNGAQSTFYLWEPFVWEFSSAISVLLLIPVVVWVLDHYPPKASRLIQSILVYSCTAFIFSIVHVMLMVTMRKLSYLFFNMSYSFGDIAFEFTYELRKDVLTFVSIIAVTYTYRFITSRLIGEANVIDEQESSSKEEPEAKPLDRLLVKKLGKEFIVKLDDVEWMESSGNYVNLHIKERIYPIRRTLGTLTEEIADKGFCRIHRSHAINLDSVDSITSLPSGDGEVTLRSGKILNISRRYKDRLKQQLL